MTSLVRRLFMILDPNFSPPFSLLQLNEKLKIIPPNGDFSSLHLPILDDSGIKIETFLSAVKHPLQSYEDITPENLKEFARHVYRLYPNMDQAQKKLVSNFWINLKEFHTKEAPSPTPQITEKSLTKLLNENQVKSSDGKA